MGDRLIQNLLLALTLAASSACATQSPLYLRKELSNSGPIPLSGSNPYIAGNLFIAREMEHSTVFDGFIRNRGTPDAIEIKRSYFRPLRIYLFYLGEAEAYLFEESAGDWLVRGPERMPPQMLRALGDIPAVGLHAPLAVQGGTSRSPRTVATESGSDEIESLRPVPTRNELANRPRERAGSPSKRSGGPSPLQSAPQVPSSRANAPVEMRRPPPPQPNPSRTEESSSGDIIHRVSFPGETLRIVAEWYTGDANNTGRIARINGIEKPNSLLVDQTIRIPRYLLRTTEPLPASRVPGASTDGSAPPKAPPPPRTIHMEDPPPDGS